MNEVKLNKCVAQPFIYLPRSRFRCIVADPPWPMKRCKGTLYPGATNTAPMKTRPLDYPVMSIADIADLPVGDLAAD